MFTNVYRLCFYYRSILGILVFLVLSFKKILAFANSFYVVIFTNKLSWSEAGRTMIFGQTFCNILMN